MGEAMTELPYVRQPVDFSAPVRYAHGPDSYLQPDVPRGAIHEYEWAASRVFPGTTRRYWVYVPVQYTPEEPASLMVFQDGRMYLDPEGEIRAAIVFDNLIHRGEMPATIGVFVDPGEPDNRNVEYDAFTDAYATFLLTEILPNVQDSYRISEDPDRWAICGGSAGACCAFTVAWMRPDRFRRVLTLLGGDDFYPELIQETPRKPLRIFLQSATRDLNWDAAEVNWVSISLRIAAALMERGYDFRFVLGDGGHDPNHGGAILPDALRWLWRPVAKLDDPEISPREVLRGASPLSRDRPIEG
jgi:enterochelin esterase-like enzyme